MNMNEAHDQARYAAENEIGWPLAGGEISTVASMAYERGWDDAAPAAWNAAIDKAQEELVRRDQFSERTLRILDELRAKEDV